MRVFILLKRVENILTKEEIAHHVFSKFSSTAEASESVCMRERVNKILLDKTFLILVIFV